MQTLKLGKHLMEIHENGKGLKERFAQVSNDAYVEENSVVYGNAEVFGSSRITGESIVCEGCRISGHASIHESDFRKGAFASDYAYVQDSQLGGNVGITDQASIINCAITCKGDARVRITDNAKLVNVKIDGECFITGSCVVRDCKLSPGTRIYGGEWIGRGPRVIITKFPFDLVESAQPGFLIISCQDRPIDMWIREGKRLGKQYGLTDVELAEYVRLVKEWKTYEEKHNAKG